MLLQGYFLGLILFVGLLDVTNGNWYSVCACNAIVVATKLNVLMFICFHGFVDEYHQLVPWHTPLTLLPLRQGYQGSSQCHRACH